MSVILPLCKHETPREGCHGCRLFATNEGYRRECAKRAGVAANEPGFLAKLGTFVKAATKHVLHGLPTVDDGEKARRLGICDKCEFFNRERGSCNKCGCNLSAKASWALEKCPVGKWEPTT